MGRVVRDIELQEKGETKWCRYTLAVDRYVKGGEKETDFLDCLAWNGAAEFASKHFTKGQRILVSGRIQTGSYTNKEGQKVQTWEIVVATQEFADSKGQSEKAEEPKKKESSDFRPLDPVADEGLPWEL
jgi:single-strand DNA-binding protein